MIRHPLLHGNNLSSFLATVTFWFLAAAHHKFPLDPPRGFRHAVGMLLFPELLQKTFVDCNRAGKTLGTAILIVGGISVLLSVLVWHVAIRTGGRELGTILGPQEQAQFEQYAWSAGTSSGMQRMIEDIGGKLEKKFDGMTPEERQAVIQPILKAFFIDVAPLFVFSVFLSLLIRLWSSTFFFVVGARVTGTFGESAIQAFSWMLPLLGLWIVMGAAMFAIVLGAAIPVILFFPEPMVIVLAILLFIALFFYFATRFALAPAILIQDRTGVFESIRRSFRLTRSGGDWLKVFGNLLGAGALIAMIVLALHLFITILAYVAQPFPPAPFVISQVLVFVALAAAAYGAMFQMRLKEMLR